MMKFKNIQVHKYLELINYSRLVRKDLEETISYLDAINSKLSKYSIKKLKLMKTELNSLIETYKQSSIVTSIVSTLVAITVVLVTAMKDLLLPDTSDEVAKNIIYFSTISACSIVFFPSLLLLRGFSKKLKMLTQLMGLVDLEINTKEEVDKNHGQAFKEYSERL